MKNQWAELTDEEKRARVARGVETRRLNREQEKKRWEKIETDMESERIVAMRRRAPILAEIDALEKRLATLRKVEAMSVMWTALTGYTLLTEEKIVAAAAPFPELCGIYFLICEKRIVYVGQSVSIPARVASHRPEKKFDSCAYVPCPRDRLDLLESLYIHFFEPRLNGNHPYTGKTAPYTMTEILARAEAGGKLAKHGRLTRAGVDL